MDGIPESVSAVSLIRPTILFPLFAYSTRYIAENTPKGTAITNDRAVITTVFIKAGKSETFSELYSKLKRSSDKFGIPFINI